MLIHNSIHQQMLRLCTITISYHSYTYAKFTLRTNLENSQTSLQLLESSPEEMEVILQQINPNIIVDDDGGTLPALLDSKVADL
jgi:hypothetical protein